MTSSHALSSLLSIALLAGCAGQVTVVEARASCPDGSRPGPDGVCGSVARIEPSKPIDPEEVDAPSPPPPPPRARVAAGADLEATLRFLRDPRGGRQARPRAALVISIQALEAQLFAASPAPPGLLKSLGDDYVELEASAERDANAKIANAARLQAIKYYSMLSTQHPKFCAAPGQACIDDVMYALGFAYERAFQLDNARKAYLGLIQNYPQSRWIPHAYLAFGEMFFHESDGDPSKYALAEQSYLEVIKYPYPGNDVHGYAILRLALVYDRKGEPAKAAQTYRKLAILARMHQGSDAIEVPAQLIPGGP